ERRVDADDAVLHRVAAHLDGVAPPALGHALPPGDARGDGAGEVRAVECLENLLKIMYFPARLERDLGRATPPRAPDLELVVIDEAAQRHRGVGIVVRDV